MKNYRCVKIQCKTLQKLDEINVGPNQIIELSGCQEHEHISVIEEYARAKMKVKGNEFVGIEITHH